MLLKILLSYLMNVANDHNFGKAYLEVCQSDSMQHTHVVSLGTFTHPFLQEFYTVYNHYNGM